MLFIRAGLDTPAQRFCGAVYLRLASSRPEGRSEKIDWKSDRTMAERISSFAPGLTGDEGRISLLRHLARIRDIARDAHSDEREMEARRVAMKWAGRIFPGLIYLCDMLDADELREIDIDAIGGALAAIR